MLVLFVEFLYSLLEISNTIELNSNKCKQFSIVKLHKDKTN